ncbi:MAG: DUF4209 domain-containing protein [Pseudomonadota bacterium]
MPLNWSLINTEVLIEMRFDGLIEGAVQRECMTYADVLSQLERDVARWTPEQRECLGFVGQVLTMGLRADQPNEPYGPMFVFDGQRSAIPADFPRDHLVPLEGWVNTLEDSELRARLLDILWLQVRSFPAAQGAVDAYLASALRLENPTSWHPSVARLERALRLAAGLGRGGAELKSRVLTEIEAMLNRHRGADPLYLSLRLIRLLREFQHGDTREFATFAAAAAISAESQRDFWRARDHYQLSADCYRVVGDANAETEALRCAAECLVKESELAYGRLGRGAMAAAGVLSDAVEAMRQVPGGRDRAAELHERLLALQQESVAELETFSTRVDITEMVERALAAVQNKPLNESIWALCVIGRPPSIEALKSEVHEQTRIAIFGSLFPCAVLNSRGRVVAQAPGLEAGVDDLQHDGLRWRMFRNARLARDLAVESMLNPARKEIFAAHGPQRHDLVPLIQYSPWIPPDHVESIVRALVAGFQGDMLLVGHLVPPQLEAMVRHVVESRGGSTSMLEPGGVQPERTLGALLETSEALQAFGADGVFELQDLLIDPLGTNLRNEVSHGVVDDQGLFGSDVLYGWWLMLRYCVVTSKLVERSQNGSVRAGATVA